MDKVGGGKGRFIIFTALSLVIAGTVFLLANNFKPSVYTVTFKTDADTVFFLYENVWEGRLIAEPETPVREHYVFGGWYSDAGFAKEWDFDSRTVSRDTTLYARWEPKKYVVTFFDGNVALYGSQQFLEYNETAAAPAVAFTRRGYDFGGWYNENGEEWDFADGITGDLDLRAGWTPKSFRVIFMDGDEPIDAADAEYDSLLPALKIAPTPPEGKYLAGWETEDGTLVDLDAPYTLTDGSAPLTLYASYRDKIYGVSFYDYGADGKYAMYASSGVVHGRTVAEPETPERNADFSGWFDGDAEWDFNTAITGDLTLCARWSAGVSYEGYGANDTVVPLWTVLNNFFTPVETGYSFIGWFTDAELQSAWDFGEPVTGHITLYAKFDINRYTLKFISGGEVYAAQTVAYGEKPVLPPNPEDEVFDYNYFGGWYL
ncbi:MAG: InlB B-repeat-containing protein, partial [Clostridiales bacterium]|nr:InlB B-repeat-containing protein [Clostridiales bacterium]